MQLSINIKQKMEKQLLLALCIVLLMACSNQTNKINEQKQDLATQAAEKSTEKISELPLGFNFGMTEIEVEEHISSLLSKERIRPLGDHKYIYTFTTKKGVDIEYWLEFRYYENTLYYVKLGLVGENISMINAIDEDLNLRLDSTFTKIGYWKEYKGAGKFLFNKWFKGNQVIFLRKAIGADLSYVNAPVDKIVAISRNQEAMNDAIEREGNVDVKNSTWDGSISQVKTYLKNNLKDRQSYESIEWSEVSTTSEGYMVRHKYRAKNSLGGYVIENQVFYLDKKGIVNKVSNVK